MRRWLVIIALFVTVLLGAGWFLLPTLVQRLATHYAGVAGLRDVTIHLDSVGTHSAHASRVDFTLDTAQGPVTVQLRDIAANYDPTSGSVRSLRAAVGTVRWRQATINSGNDEAIVIPPLPAARLRINELQLFLQTPAGELSLPGALSATVDPDTGVRLDLVGSNETVHALLPPDASRVSLQLTNRQQQSVVNADIADPLGDNTRIVLDIDPKALRDWLPARIPDNKPLRDWLAALDMEKGAATLRIDYQPEHAQWSMPEARINLNGFRSMDTVSSAALAFKGEPIDNGWRFESITDGQLKINGPGQPSNAFSGQLKVAEGTKIELIDNDAQMTVAGHGPLQWRIQDRDNDLTGSLDQWRFDSTGTSTALIRDVDLKPHGVRAKSLSVTSTGPPGDILANGTIKVAGLSIKPVNKKKPATTFDLAGNWSYKGNEVSVNGDSHVGTAPLGQWQVKTDLNKGTGSARIKIATQAPELSGFLASMATVSSSLVIHQGQVHADLTLNWNKRGISANARADTKQLDADIEQAQLRGVEISLLAKDLLKPNYVFSLQVPTTLTAIGVDITDFRVNGSWRDNVINIDEAVLSVLGGQLRVPAEQLVFGQDHKLLVKAHDLDLAQLLALVDVSGLTGSGRLNGELPLLIYPGGVEISDSTITSDGAGILRYQLDPGGNSQLDNIALQALRDFRYESMSVKIRYKRNGDYLIRVRLKGSNPQLYNGFPLALNVNLNGNLPDILRTAVLTGDFDREVLKRVQSEKPKVQAPGGGKK